MQVLSPYNTLGTNGMAHGNSLRFQTDRFDFLSDLPQEYNVGNRFYGRDVADFITAGLRACGMAATSMDEDWGWLVSGNQSSGQPFEVAIYNLSAHREGGRPGSSEWGLWIRAYERKTFLGLVARNVETSVSPALDAAVRAVFTSQGIDVEVWDEDTTDDA